LDNYGMAAKYDTLTLTRNQLLSLIDDVWQEATESTEVPDPRWADRIIENWIDNQKPK
jgi:hypothetical protein